MARGSGRPTGVTDPEGAVVRARQTSSRPAHAGSEHHAAGAERPVSPRVVQEGGSAAEARGAKPGPGHSHLSHAVHELHIQHPHHHSVGGVHHTDDHHRHIPMHGLEVGSSHRHHAKHHETPSGHAHPQHPHGHSASRPEGGHSHHAHHSPHKHGGHVGMKPHGA